jgi:tetratricopeptide (TPR) repeat protein
LSNYYDATDYKLVDITDHLDPKFSFSIKGKIQASMNEGYNEYLEGNYFRAIKNLNEVIKHDSTYWPAYYYRGLCYKNSFKLDSATADLQKALKEALGCADELMKLDPSNSERRFEKTKLLIRLNRTKEAKKELALLRAANYAAAENLCKRYLDN